MSLPASPPGLNGVLRALPKLEEGGVGNGEATAIPGDDPATGAFFEVLAALLAGDGVRVFPPPEEGVPSAVDSGSSPGEGGNFLPLGVHLLSRNLPSRPEAAIGSEGESRYLPRDSRRVVGLQMPPLFQVPGKEGESVSVKGGLSGDLLSVMIDETPQVSFQQVMTRLSQSGVTFGREGSMRGESVPGALLPPLYSFTEGNGTGSVSHPSHSSPSFSLSHSLGSPQWQNALGERLVWMVRNEFQQAEIRLNPQHLGPVEVRIEIRNEQASINFSAHHMATRDTLEAAIPRLREMLGEAGVFLANVNVSQQQTGQQRQQEGRGQKERAISIAGEKGGSEQEDFSSRPSVLFRGAGLIDLFA